MVYSGFLNNHFTFNFNPFLSDLISYKLERQDLVVSELFTLFNSSRSRVGILDWGIKMTTLEDGKANLYIFKMLHCALC